MMHTYLIWHQIPCYDVFMPRTTLTLRDDAIKAARAHAARHGLTLGEAVSDLVRQAAERPMATDERSGLRVARLRPSSPKVSAALVDKLRDDLP